MVLYEIASTTTPVHILEETGGTKILFGTMETLVTVLIPRIGQSILAEEIH